jgi:hypothetical protein
MMRKTARSVLGDLKKTKALNWQMPFMLWGKIREPIGYGGAAILWDFWKKPRVWY